MQTVSITHSSEASIHFNLLQKDRNQLQKHHKPKTMKKKTIQRYNSGYRSRATQAVHFNQLPHEDTPGPPFIS